MAAANPALGRLEGMSRRFMMVGVVGALALVAGLFLSREQFFRAYLAAYLFWAGIGLGCLGVLLLHNVVGGGWGVGTRRLFESGARTVPFLALLFIPILFGMKDLYMWTRPEVLAQDELLQKKELYLNLPFWLGRCAFYFVVWTVMALRISSQSLALDRNMSQAEARTLRVRSGGGIVLYFMTMTFAAIDWVMALDPHWFSTIFGMLFVVGDVLAAFAFIIILTVLLFNEKPMSEVVDKGKIYDLGNLLLAFVMLWAYLAFSQYLIIFAGNLPEEIPWYLERLHGGWRVVALAIIMLHFALPFMLLISRYTKRNPRALVTVALIIIVMRFVETVWVVVPAGEGGHGIPLGWVDLAAPLGIGGLWLAVFLRELKGRWDVVGHNRHLAPEEAHVGA